MEMHSVLATKQLDLHEHIQACVIVFDLSGARGRSAIANMREERQRNELEIEESLLSFHRHHPTTTMVGS